MPNKQLNNIQMLEKCLKFLQMMLLNSENKNVKCFKNMTPSWNTSPNTISFQLGNYDKFYKSSL